MNDRLRTEDAQARAAALDPARSFIVQAPAGSGKTELLTQRYLVLLARVDHPEEILAVTFTNKAAAEMRDRVLRALARARDATPPEAAHQRLTWQLARDVLARDATAGWQLEHNPRRLRVQTIDALCAALARQLPLAAGFGALPATVEDAHDHYRAAARETLALIESGNRWTEATACLVRHLDNHLGQLEELLARMLARRDQWLRHVTGRRDRPALEAALANVVRDALAALTAAAPAAEGSEIAALADYAAANLGREGVDVPLRTCTGLTGLPGAVHADLGAWLGIAQLLLTNEGEWRAQVNKKIGFPAASSGGSGAEKAAFDAAKQRLTQLLARLEGRDEFRARLHALRGLPAPRYGEEQWAILEALTELLPVAAAQLKLVFRARGEVDFMAVAHGALEALGPADEPSDLALRLDYRLRHILVDEFQDTSLSQYQLLERLTAGWEPGDGRTLFAVGDPMQSIYRFREAEVGLYLRARREGLGGLPLAPLALAVNFRSQQGVVDWVNEAFARVLPAVEDLSVGAVPYASAQGWHAALPGPAVSVHPRFGDDPGDEGRQVAAIVAEARAADPDGSIAILVRARSHLAEIVPQLRAAGVRFLALDIEPLGHRQAVQDLFALTRALEHPADRLAWLSVLRAPWCGLTLADLQALVGDGTERVVWELVNDTARVARLSPDGQARLARVTEPFARALPERRRLPLRRAVEGLWLALGGPACVLAPADLDDAEVFFALLERIETAGGLVDFALLEEDLTRLFALPDAGADSAVVQIMTLHKAKGLEFDTVIVPGLGRAPPRPESPLLAWAERPRAHAAADLLLAPIRAAGADKDPIYAYLKRLDAERGRLEDGRLLYVAATRAKKRLHLLGHTQRDADGNVREPAAGSLLRTLWPAVHGTYRAAAAAPVPTPAAAGEAPRPALPGIRRLTRDWRLPPAPPAVEGAAVSPPAADQAVEFDWAGETARHVGTVVHRYLLRIARDGAAHWSEARLHGLHEVFARQLARRGVAQHECQAAARRAAQALANTLADERGRWLLDDRHPEARSEFALSGVLGGRCVNLALDRTFVDAQGVRWIVDYKTGVHTGAGREEFLDRERVRYAPQLERYAHLMVGLDARPIRLGLYFPLLGGWREWAPGDI